MTKKLGNDEGLLTLTVRMKVSPEFPIIDLMKRYLNALNYCIEWIIKNSIKVGKKYKLPKISEIHRNLYYNIKIEYELPPRIAIDCYREAIAIAKGYLRNKVNGKIPRKKKLSIWLTSKKGYRIKGEYVELIGGYKLKIIGYDRRYEEYENREARLVYRDGELYLFIFKKISKPKEIEPNDAIAVDINEKHIYFGNNKFVEKIGTRIIDVLHYINLIEKLQKKYSFSKYIVWLRRNKILKRIKSWYRKVRNIIDDYVKQVSYKLVKFALQNKLAIIVEDLKHIKNDIGKLAKNIRKRLNYFTYRKLLFWIEWQAKKHGVKVIKVNPKGTSSKCPICGSKLIKKNNRIMKCRFCNYEENRDVIAVLNLYKMGGFTVTPTAPQMTDVIPNRCGETVR